eukprot:4454569-Alexandrium_andersonii.AAC.1
MRPCLQHPPGVPGATGRGGHRPLAGGETEGLDGRLPHRGGGRQEGGRQGAARGCGGLEDARGGG